MSRNDIVWTSYPPGPEDAKVSCSLDLPSGKTALLTLWDWNGNLCAHAVDMRTGLVVMPHFQPAVDCDLMERQAWRYGLPLIREALH